MKVFSALKKRTGAVRFAFTLHIHRLSPWPASCKTVAIAWQRGSKRKKKGITDAHKPIQVFNQLGTAIEFNERIELSATLYMDGDRPTNPKGPFKKKCLILAIIETDSRTNNASPLGRVVIDLGEYASLQSEIKKDFAVACSKSVQAAVGEPNLEITIKSSWKSVSGPNSYASSLSSDRTGGSFMPNVTGVLKGPQNEQIQVRLTGDQYVDLKGFGKMESTMTPITPKEFISEKQIRPSIKSPDGLGRNQPGGGNGLGAPPLMSEPYEASDILHSSLDLKNKELSRIYEEKDIEGFLKDSDIDNYTDELDEFEDDMEFQKQMKEITSNFKRDESQVFENNHPMLSSPDNEEDYPSSPNAKIISFDLSHVTGSSNTGNVPDHVNQWISQENNMSSNSTELPFNERYATSPFARNRKLEPESPTVGFLSNESNAKSAINTENQDFQNEKDKQGTGNVISRKHLVGLRRRQRSINTVLDGKSSGDAFDPNYTDSNEHNSSNNDTSTNKKLTSFEFATEKVKEEDIISETPKTLIDNDSTANAINKGAEHQQRAFSRSVPMGPLQSQKASNQQQMKKDVNMNVKTSSMPIAPKIQIRPLNNVEMMENADLIVSSKNSSSDKLNESKKSKVSTDVEMKALVARRWKKKGMEEVVKGNRKNEDRSDVDEFSDEVVGLDSGDEEIYTSSSRSLKSKNSMTRGRVKNNKGNGNNNNSFKKSGNIVLLNQLRSMAFLEVSVYLSRSSKL